MDPNPETIAWYVERAENLLDDLRERVQSQRSRGGQLAGFSGAVIALAGANAESMLGAVHHAARAKEVANYITERFTHEPDLWRVHVRTIRGLLKAIHVTTRQNDKTARAVTWAGRLFLAGLSAVGVALVILISVVSF